MVCVHEFDDASYTKDLMFSTLKSKLDSYTSG